MFKALKCVLKVNCIQFLSVIFQIDSHFLYFYFILSIYSISQRHNNNKNPNRCKSGLKIDGLVLECTQVTKWTRPTSVCDWNKLRLSPPISILLQWIAKKTIWHFFSVNLQINYDVNIGLIKRRQRQKETHFKMQLIRTQHFW